MKTRSDIFQKMIFLKEMAENDTSLVFDFFGVYFRGNSAYVASNNFMCIIDSEFENMKKYGMMAYFDELPLEDRDCPNPIPPEMIKVIRKQKRRFINSFSVIRSELIDEDIQKSLKNPAHWKNSCFNIKVEQDKAVVTINTLKGVVKSEYGVSLINKKIIRPRLTDDLILRINLYYLKDILDHSMDRCDIINFKFDQKDDWVLIQGRDGKTSINWIIGQLSLKK